MISGKTHLLAMTVLGSVPSPPPLRAYCTFRFASMLTDLDPSGARICEGPRTAVTDERDLDDGPGLLVGTTALLIVAADCAGGPREGAVDV